MSQIGKEGCKNEKPACAAILPPVLEIRKPRITPIRPPIAPKIPDSITKIDKISLFLAPTAFIIPISFVLSTTAVYIVFIVFTEATIKETKAIKTKIPLKINIILLKVCNASSNVCTKKSSLPSS